MGRIEQVDDVKPEWKVELVPVPRAEAEEAFERILDLFADAIADKLIAEARAEVAAELGKDPRAIDREHSRETRRAVADFGLPSFGEDR